MSVSKTLRALSFCSIVFLSALVNQASAQTSQTEAEFQKLMPITGKVKTNFGEFELDHSFPTKDTADKIYDLMDSQRASQLYLWSLPIVATTRIRHSLKDNIEGYQDNRFVTIRRFNERRGFLTANESTIYFISASDTS